MSDAAEGRRLWTERVEAELAALGAVEIVVGLATEGPTPAAGGVAGAVHSGLGEHFPECRSVVVHVEQTGSEEAALPIAQALDGLPSIRLGPADLTAVPKTGGMLERDLVLQAILAVGERLEARAVLVLNPALSSTSGAWVAGLAGPILKEECGFVLPVYHRGRYEGTLTQALVVPLVRALFGPRAAHPIAEEFACSGDAARRLLDHECWGSELGQEGIEFWLPPAAVTLGIPLAQAVLGLRVMAAGVAAEPVGTTVGRAASALFGAAERFEAAWLEVRESTPVPTYGDGPRVSEAGAAVNVDRMLAGFRRGALDLFPLWERILAPETLGEVLVLAEAGTDDFRFPDRLWARVVYDFLLAYRFRVAYRSHVTGSLAPLYLGRTASVVLETRGKPASAVWALTERLARLFEREKDYLVERWH